MFNLSKKTNLKDKEKCYLWNSGVLDREIFKGDVIDAYNELLEDEEVPMKFKEFIINFLIPYNISILKFSFNQEYFNDPFPVDFEYNHRHIAPSLRILKENPWDLSMGYPTWFYIAFPDVAIWAINGDGLELIKKRFKGLSEEELTDGRHIRPNHLNDIIRMYINKTNRSLECKIY